MDYHSLSRRQLQLLCKKNGLPANSTNVEMADALSALLKVPEEKSIAQEKRVARRDASSVKADAAIAVPTGEKRKEDEKCKQKGSESSSATGREDRRSTRQHGEAGSLSETSSTNAVKPNEGSEPISHRRSTRQHEDADSRFSEVNIGIKAVPDKRKENKKCKAKGNESSYATARQEAVPYRRSTRQHGEVVSLSEAPSANTEKPKEGYEPIPERRSTRQHGEVDSSFSEADQAILTSIEKSAPAGDKRNEIGKCKAKGRESSYATERQEIVRNRRSTRQHGEASLSEASSAKTVKPNEESEPISCSRSTRRHGEADSSFSEADQIALGNIGKTDEKEGTETIAMKNVAKKTRSAPSPLKASVVKSKSSKFFFRKGKVKVCSPGSRSVSPKCKEKKAIAEITARSQNGTQDDVQPAQTRKKKGVSFAKNVEILCEKVESNDKNSPDPCQLATLSQAGIMKATSGKTEDCSNIGPKQSAELLENTRKLGRRKKGANAGEGIVQVTSSVHASKKSSNDLPNRSAIGCVEKMSQQSAKVDEKTRKLRGSRKEASNNEATTEADASAHKSKKSSNHLLFEVLGEANTRHLEKEFDHNKSEQSTEVHGYARKLRGSTKEANSDEAATSGYGAKKSSHTSETTRQTVSAETIVNESSNNDIATVQSVDSGRGTKSCSNKTHAALVASGSGTKHAEEEQSVMYEYTRKRRGSKRELGDIQATVQASASRHGTKDCSNNGEITVQASEYRTQESSNNGELTVQTAESGSGNAGLVACGHGIKNSDKVNTMASTQNLRRSRRLTLAPSDILATRNLVAASKGTETLAENYLTEISAKGDDSDVDQSNYKKNLRSSQRSTLVAAGIKLIQQKEMSDEQNDESGSEHQVKTISEQTDKISSRISNSEEQNRRIGKKNIPKKTGVEGNEEQNEGRDENLTRSRRVQKTFTPSTSQKRTTKDLSKPQVDREARNKKDELMVRGKLDVKHSSARNVVRKEAQDGQSAEANILETVLETRVPVVVDLLSDDEQDASSESEEVLKKDLIDLQGDSSSDICNFEDKESECQNVFPTSFMIMTEKTELSPPNKGDTIACQADIRAAPKNSDGSQQCSDSIHVEDSLTIYLEKSTPDKPLSGEKKLAARHLGKLDTCELDDIVEHVERNDVEDNIAEETNGIVRSEHKCHPDRDWDLDKSEIKTAEGEIILQREIMPRSEQADSCVSDVSANLSLSPDHQCHKEEVEDDFTNILAGLSPAIDMAGSDSEANYSDEEYCLSEEEEVDEESEEEVSEDDDFEGIFREKEVNRCLDNELDVNRCLDNELDFSSKEVDSSDGGEVVSEADLQSSEWEECFASGKEDNVFLCNGLNNQSRHNELKEKDEVETIYKDTVNRKDNELIVDHEDIFQEEHNINCSQTVINTATTESNSVYQDQMAEDFCAVFDESKYNESLNSSMPSSKVTDITNSTSTASHCEEILNLAVTAGDPTKMQMLAPKIVVDNQGEEIKAENVSPLTEECYSSHLDGSVVVEYSIPAEGVISASSNVFLDSLSSPEMLPPLKHDLLEKEQCPENREKCVAGLRDLSMQGSITKEYQAFVAASVVAETESASHVLKISQPYSTSLQDKSLQCGEDDRKFEDRTEFMYAQQDKICSSLTNDEPNSTHCPINATVDASILSNAVNDENEGENVGFMCYQQDESEVAEYEEAGCVEVIHSAADAIKNHTEDQADDEPEKALDVQFQDDSLSGLEVTLSEYKDRKENQEPGESELVELLQGISQEDECEVADSIVGMEVLHCGEDDYRKSIGNQETDQLKNETELQLSAGTDQAVTDSIGGIEVAHSAEETFVLVGSKRNEESEIGINLQLLQGIELQDEASSISSMKPREIFDPIQNQGNEHTTGIDLLFFQGTHQQDSIAGVGVSQCAEDEICYPIEREKKDSETAKDLQLLQITAEKDECELSDSTGGVEHFAENMYENAIEDQVNEKPETGIDLQVSHVIDHQHTESKIAISIDGVKINQECQQDLCLQVTKLCKQNQWDIFEDQIIQQKDSGIKGMEEVVNVIEQQSPDEVSVEEARSLDGNLAAKSVFFLTNPETNKVNAMHVRAAASSIEAITLNRDSLDCNLLADSITLSGFELKTEACIKIHELIENVDVFEKASLENAEGYSASNNHDEPATEIHEEEKAVHEKSRPLLDLDQDDQAVKVQREDAEGEDEVADVIKLFAAVNLHSGDGDESSSEHVFLPGCDFMDFEEASSSCETESFEVSNDMKESLIYYLKAEEPSSSTTEGIPNRYEGEMENDDEMLLENPGKVENLSLSGITMKVQNAAGTFDTQLSHESSQPVVMRHFWETEIPVDKFYGLAKVKPLSNLLGLKDAKQEAVFNREEETESSALSSYDMIDTNHSIYVTEVVHGSPVIEIGLQVQEFKDGIVNVQALTESNSDGEKMNAHLEEVMQLDEKEEKCMELSALAIENVEEIKQKFPQNTFETVMWKENESSAKKPAYLPKTLVSASKRSALKAIPSNINQTPSATATQKTPSAKTQSAKVHQVTPRPRNLLTAYENLEGLASPKPQTASKRVFSRSHHR